MMFDEGFRDLMTINFFSIPNEVSFSQLSIKSHQIYKHHIPFISHELFFKPRLRVASSLQFWILVPTQQRFSALGQNSLYLSDHSLRMRSCKLHWPLHGIVQGSDCHHDPQLPRDPSHHDQSSLNRGRCLPELLLNYLKEAPTASDIAGELQLSLHPCAMYFAWLDIGFSDHVIHSEFDSANFDIFGLLFLRVAILQKISETKTKRIWTRKIHPDKIT